LSQNWYFRNRQQTWGPFSSPEIKNLAAAGLLQPDDLIWSEEGDSRKAVEARAVLAFNSLQRVAVPAPDWLDDVQDEQGPVPIRWNTHAIPDWIEDVGRWENIDPLSVKQPSALPTTAEAEPELTGASTDEIRGVESENERPLIAANQNEVRSPSPENAVVQARTTVITLTGFDPQSGQILDADRFRKWQREQNQQADRRLAKSLQEVFFEARRAVEAWVDAEANRNLIITGDPGSIRRDVELQESINRYANYGSVMLARLWTHLEFMVENRRSFYQALSQKH